jgi:hypothetical protein
MLLTFGLTVFAWIFFRAENISHAFSYISEIFSNTLFTYPTYDKDDSKKTIFILLFIFIIIEWVGRENQFAIQQLGLKWVWPLRLTMYFIILIIIFWFGGSEQQFIYFQF